ncbi:5-formyltetrahydrofolate cyclo-ligase [Planctomonas psychrotolerans]|uniref:5-formyltetrahydrofolate cyclo-ligase n=1 Tax=Planctomonas psychrotolerans TaxID=2528712 RepID=UPI0012384345|nr:5-formyltetrahydrofolate cyclo-ligase [Planctomonas psychrotolerans]
MVSDEGHRKRALRRELRERRRHMTSSERQAASEGLTRNLVTLVEDLDVRSISCYLAATDEPNTRPFLDWANDRGIRILFPISREDGLLDWVVSDARQETEGLFGLPEPVGEVLSPLAINAVDLIIVPAAAVDSAGIRMGWGRGYFDKTLGSMEACPPVYAVVFDSEFVDSVPREVHDQPVNGIVTPTRVVTF